MAGAVHPGAMHPAAMTSMPGAVHPAARHPGAMHPGAIGTWGAGAIGLNATPKRIPEGKRINSPEDMETWLGPELYSQLLAFVVSLSDSVVSRERSPEQLGEASA